MLETLEMNQLICANSDPTNEGQPTVLCANFIAHVVNHANRTLCPVNEPWYKFEVFPVVREEADKRQNKASDYSIFKIFNRKTYVVVEVKLCVGARLTKEDQNKLAQLFLEAVYIFRLEGKSNENKIISCVLTDGTTWHIIKTCVDKLPLHFESIFTCSTTTTVENQNQKWNFNLGTICDQLVGHIEACHKAANSPCIHNSETEP